MTDPGRHPPAPDFRATVVLLAGLAITPLAATGTTPEELAHSYALWVAASILLSVAVDYRQNLRNLVRADLMAIGAFYFLTLFEFLLPQKEFTAMVGLPETETALLACVAGFIGLTVGRHLAPQAPRSVQQVLHAEIGPGALIKVYTVSLICAYFYMWVSTNFDLVEMVHYFMAPRFSQPWGRGKFGDWRALLGELGLVIYLIPPIAGVVFARRSQFTNLQKYYVAIGFLLTLFYGFSSGTRNIFFTFLATFLVALAFAIDPKKKRELIAVGSLVGAVILAATVVMVEFRNIGLNNYIKGYAETKADKNETKFFVDYNLYVIAKLTTVFPTLYPHLGLEIPYLSLVRPIPRAVWSGKPEGLSISIEDAVGVEGLTLASSFAGEAYMSGGILGVILTGLAFGMINGWWNRFAFTHNSSLGHLIFASGFFAAVISMRSMFVFTTAILPTIAALVLANWLIGKRIRAPGGPGRHAG
ncbi:MAG: hypothetical protein RIQ93_2033 [Verrucomicrobiota bacterium]|jgi:hypothetical protein